MTTKSFARTGEVEIIDFMPLNCNHRDNLNPEIHRLVECIRGDVHLKIEWFPKFNFARAPCTISKEDNWVASNANNCMVMAGIDEAQVVQSEYGPKLLANFGLVEGENKVIVNKWGVRSVQCSVPKTERLLKATLAKSKNLINHKVFETQDWTCEYASLLKRSALTLKLLTHSDTGAIAAAATTSLPEWIGGEMNWDYRYSWIRDTALTTQALVMLGNHDDAMRFLHWAEDNDKQHFEKEKRFFVVYDFHGGIDFPEMKLDNLEGYKCSRPVRVGNRAVKQNQHGILGDVFAIAYELARRGVKLKKEIMSYLSKVAEYACQVWHKPDHGIWERAKSLHYVESKVMVWMALDRALFLANNFELKGNTQKWQKVQNDIYNDVLENGYDEDLGSFLQSYGSKYIDAANLRIPLLEFLPIDDKRVQATIVRVKKDLLVNGHVYRNNNPVERPIGNKGNLPREEGAFNICTFWLIDVLSLSGRTVEARKLFEGMIRCVNSVGLYSEEIDPRNGEFLGNFPQGFTHIGLINSAMYLSYAEGKKVPITLIGTKEHRDEMKRQN